MKALELFLLLILSLGLLACSKNETPVDTPRQVAPTITTQPSDANVIVGHNAIFSVAATGTEPLSYQWKKNGANVAGATSTTYVFPSVQSDSAATISCAVTNAVGSAMSRAAVLTLVTLPAILSQPISQTVEAGLPATFIVSATGTAPLSYQWKRNGVDVAGATSASYTLSTVVQADSGAMFHTVVSNSAGSVTSSSAVLTVQTVIAIGRPLFGGVICFVDSTGVHGKYFTIHEALPWGEALTSANNLGGNIPSIVQLQSMFYPNKTLFGMTGYAYWSSEHYSSTIAFAVLFNATDNPHLNGNWSYWNKLASHPTVVMFPF